MGAAEIAIIVLVVGARLLLPLTIPYFPLVGVVSCLILDSVDQSIFQQFPAIDLEGYQSYDKALDIYYLSITYLATVRNWDNRPAFRMSQFLYFYRLVGVVAFELTQVRAILFIFPNTFEYFFIFYELVRARWNTSHMGKKTVIVATILIWVFIKLPQEWWIHIAKLDMTDFMKTHIFGVSADSSWGQAIAASPWVVAALALGLALVLFAIWWLVTHKAPAADYRLRLKADPLPPELIGPELYRTVRAGARTLDWALAQKAVMVALVTVIFAQFLAGANASALQTAVSVAVFVVLNAFVSQWLARRGRSWQSVALELGAMVAVNFVLVAALKLAERLVGLGSTHIPFVTLLFFLFLITLLIVMFDRYHTVYVARRILESNARAAAGAAAGAESAERR